MSTNKDKIRAAAQKYLQKGQLDKAIKEFERLVEDDPNDVRTLLKIGDLQVRKGDQQAATKTYGSVAKYYSDQGFFLKAVAVYKHILKLDPNLQDINQRLAELYQQLGLVSDAINQYRAICELYEKEEKWDEALRVLRKMVELDADNVPSRVKLADVLARQGKNEEAKAELAQAATQLKRDNRLDDWSKVGERLCQIDPNDQRLNKQLAQYYVQKNDARRALAKLQVCFRADPKDIETLDLLADVFTDLGQGPKALSVLRELAALHLQGNQRAPAEKALRRILVLDPQDAEALAALNPAQPRKDPDLESVDLPDADVEAYNLGDAIEVEAVQADAAAATAAAAPEDVNELLVEADIYIKYGLRDKAIDHLDRILAHHPEHREAQGRYKNVLIDADDVDGAVRMLWAMAQAASRGGQIDLAKVDLEELLGINPAFEPARELMRSLDPAGALAVPAAAPSRAAAPASNTVHIVAFDTSVTFDADGGAGAAGHDDRLASRWTSTPPASPWTSVSTTPLAGRRPVQPRR